MYNSPEERAMIQARRRQRAACPRSSSASAPRCRPTRSRSGSARSSTSAGPSRSTSAASTRTRAARSCSTTSRPTCAKASGKLSLVLIGNSMLPVPEHPRIRHLGFLDDATSSTRWRRSELLIMPSYFESLSMVALEAWALGRPVLANGRCDVLQGPVHPQQRRPLLRQPAGVRRDAARHRAQPRG